ncbi:MAG: GFA family protein [Gammaproteobacteria bacterium]|nr:GFA family protein [Gammaproteobacteria bacterium]
MSYCHCHYCRKWHSAPVNAWALWPNDKVRMQGQVTEFRDLTQGVRISCAQCGAGVANRKPEANMIVVYPMTLVESGLKFEPTSHIYYSKRVLDLSDGLPKYVDMPVEWGGSGETMDEPPLTRWI